MDFEWDDTKAASNESKHGVPFAEAITVFADPLALTGADPGHSEDEDRYITMGTSAAGRLLIVSHTDWGKRCGSSALVRRADVSGRTTKMAISPEGTEDDLQPEYDFRAIRG